MLQAEKETITLFKNIGHMHGLDSLTTEIFIIALLEPDCISLEELSKRTGYSLASVSNKVKLLERMAIATKHRKPGDKKVYLHVDKKISKVTKKQIIKHREIETLPVLEKLPKIVSNFKKEAKTKKDKEKAKILENYYNDIKKMDKLTMELFNRV